MVPKYFQEIRISILGSIDVPFRMDKNGHDDFNPTNRAFC